MISAEAVRPRERGAQSRRSLGAVTVLAMLLVLAACEQPAHVHFDGKRAYAHARTQMEWGPRPVGSEEAAKTAEYIARHLERYGWTVEYQDFAVQGLQIRNVIGKKGAGPVVILGTHLDTRPVADLDPVNRSLPVPGANGGVSGVGVLLELARALGPEATDQAEIRLAFFDGSTRGGLGSFPECAGARHMADKLLESPDLRRVRYTLMIDLVGDADQQFYYEWNSTMWVQERVWAVAAELNYQSYFVPEHRHNLVSDHLVFVNRGLPVALIADGDYAYKDTTQDTLDKISADSLQRVGDVLESLLEGEPFAVGPSE